MIRLLRPEAMSSHEHPLLGVCFQQCTARKTFAPGDMIVSLKLGSWLDAVWSLLGGIVPNKQAAGKSQDSSAIRPAWDIFRMTLRKDFPHVGQASFATIDLTS